MAFTISTTFFFNDMIFDVDDFFFEVGGAGDGKRECGGRSWRRQYLLQSRLLVRFQEGVDLRSQR